MIVRETNEKLLLTSSIKHIAESLHVLHEVLIIWRVFGAWGKCFSLLDAWIAQKSFLVINDLYRSLHHSYV